MGWVVNAKPRPLYPRGRGPVPIIQEGGWATGSDWTGSKNFAATEIRSPDGAARSFPCHSLRHDVILVRSQQRVI